MSGKSAFKVPVPAILSPSSGSAEIFPGHGISPYDFHWEYACGAPESEQGCRVKSWYLLYFGFKRPAYMDFFFDENTEFEIHVIDTWNMSIEQAGTSRGRFRVSLPGREYMCIRLIRKADP